jgi:deoxyribose-phosphate aldolase
MDTGERAVDLRELAGRIDLSFLKIDSQTTVPSLRAAIDQMQHLGVRCLVVPPLLAGTVKRNHPELKVCAVIAYPLGMETLAAKVFAASELIEQGVDELDVVLDLFALVNNNFAKLEHEARDLLAVTRAAKVPLKTIIETPILTDQQIVKATDLLCNCGVECIKTSTGYNREPTRMEHVRLIKEAARGRAFIKASGGIRSQAQALAMLEAGADVLGVSDAAAILTQD